MTVRIHLPLLLVDRRGAGVRGHGAGGTANLFTTTSAS